MEKDWNKTDSLFRERLSNFEEKPDDRVWDKISSRLGSKSNKRKIFLLLRIAAGMTLLFSLGLGYYLINRQTMPPRPSSLSFEGGTKSDTVRAERARKSQTDKPEKKKKEKSDRLGPVRRIYKGPDLTSEDESHGKRTELSENYSSQDKNILDIRKQTDRIPVRLHGIYPLLENRTVPEIPGHRPVDSPLPVYAEAGPDDGSGDNPYDETGIRRWMLGAEVAPLYSYRALQSDNFSAAEKSAMNSSETGLLAYAGGIRIAYSAGKRFSVQSGVYYSRYGQEKGNVKELMNPGNIALKDNATYVSIPNSTGKISMAISETSDKTEYVFNSDIRNNFIPGEFGVATFDVVPVQGTDISAVQYFDYLELPVIVKYKIIDRKLGFSFVGGLVTNFLVNNDISLKESGNVRSIGKTSGINQINYLGSVGLGFDYPLLKNVSFSFEPRFRYYLNPIDRNNVHPYSFGIFGGVSYCF